MKDLTVASTLIIIAILISWGLITYYSLDQADMIPVIAGGLIALAIISFIMRR